MVSALEENQAARRRRVVDAALRLAAAGGFEAVQMRDVASAADIAVGTLYRYFPSKECLLVNAMRELVDAHADALRSNPAVGSTPAARVMNVLERAVPLHPEREVFAAMIRALAIADQGVADIVADINETMSGTLTDAMSPVPRPADWAPTERDAAVARVLQQVWLAAVIGWLGGVSTQPHILADLATTVTLLLGNPKGNQ